MSTEDKPVEAPQFQKPGDLVERDEDTGVMQLESLCMNCHENVRFLLSLGDRWGILTPTKGNHPTSSPARSLLPRHYS